MSSPLSILLVEDSPLDAGLLEFHLREAGLEASLFRVDTEDELRKALAHGEWEIVLSDFRMPTLDGMDVLRILNECDPSLPCIIVSGQIGEEYAVDALRAGGRDFVSKNNLSRLVPAIQREIQEAETRRQSHAVEQELRRNQELFSIITGNVVDLLAIVDAEGRRIYTSPSYNTVLGYTGEEMTQFSAIDLVHPEEVEKVAQVIREISAWNPTSILSLGTISVESGPGDALSLVPRVHALTFRLRHKDGHYIPFEANASLVIDPEGGAPRALFVGRNITERVQAEQERQRMEVLLRQAQKLEAIGHLAAGIAHEINTPIQYVGDNITFLRNSLEELFGHIRHLIGRLQSTRDQGGPGSEMAVECLEVLAEADFDHLEAEIPQAIEQSQEGVGRVSRIVNATKDFSHPGSDTKTPSDLNRAIESTLTVSRNEWKYIAELQTDLDPDLPPVPCFPNEFNQVILNLVVNAAHAIEEKQGGYDGGKRGHIRVATRRAGPEVEITVSDNGSGIPEAIRDRIFDPFFTTKPVGKGTGQGLAIVHAVIVDKHHGRISLETDPGRGTTFHLFLPLDLRSPEVP